MGTAFRKHKRDDNGNDGEDEGMNRLRLALFDRCSMETVPLYWMLSFRLP